MQEQTNYPALNQPVDELALTEIKGAILAKLRLAIGKDATVATRRDWYKAAALALRDRIVHHWLTAEKQTYDAGAKRVGLSLAGIFDRPPVHRRAEQYGPAAAVRGGARRPRRRLSDLRKCEPDAALGNGGLGRLAACFMESMATLAIPATGYGIRYDFGLFRQIMNRGLAAGISRRVAGVRQPWEFQRPEVVYNVHFGGNVEHVEERGRDRAIWHPAETVEAMAYDTPIVGWRGQHVNALRLWSARAPDPLKLDVFNSGDYVSAQRRAGARRSDLQIPLSERRERGGPRAAAAPGIFLRLGLVAGSGRSGISPPTAACATSRRRPPCSSTTPIRASRSPS